MTKRYSVLAFDVFGTTVDWFSGVSAKVGPELADAWRERYLPLLARVNSGEREWANLDVLHRESLDELLAVQGIDAGEEARRQMVLAWHRLPAWDDVVDGLSRLREHYVLAALSNGGFALLTTLIKSAGLPFDCIVSAELFRAYKPDPRPYRATAELLAVRPEEVLMVAAHAWDLGGARAAGLGTAFVERPREKGPHRAADRAVDTASDISVANFGELADLLTEG